MGRDEVQVEHSPGVLKRLVSRVRSNSAQHNRKKSTDTTSIPTNASNHSDDTAGPYQRSRAHTLSFRAPSFRVGSGYSIPPIKKSPVSAPTHPEAPSSLELWNEAYDSLRNDPSINSLVVTYESIISQELPDDLKAAAHATISQANGDTIRRLELMTAISSAGLSKRRGSKTSQVDESARQILEQSKRIVEAQVDVFPSAALAWSGICTMTPLLIDPILSHPEFRRGMIHVIGRIPWYMHLTHILQCPSWIDADDFDARRDQLHPHRDRARDTVIQAYRRVLEFEMNCVCAAASAWNAVAKHTVRWKTIDELVDSIFDTDERLRQIISQHVVESERRNALLARNHDLDITELERVQAQEEEDLCIKEMTEPAS